MSEDWRKVSKDFVEIGRQIAIIEDCMSAIRAISTHSDASARTALRDTMRSGRKIEKHAKMLLYIIEQNTHSPTERKEKS